MEKFTVAKPIGLGVLAGACVGFFGSYFGRAKPLKKFTVLDDVIQALKEFNRTSDVVIEERSKILQTLNDFSKEASYRLVNVPKPHELFSEGFKVAVVSPARQKRNKLISELEELLKSYPQFEDAQHDDPNYIRRIHKQLLEHHAQTVTIAALVFEELNAVISPKSSEQRLGVSL